MITMARMKNRTMKRLRRTTRTAMLPRAETDKIRKTVMTERKRGRAPLTTTWKIITRTNPWVLRCA